MEQRRIRHKVIIASASLLLASCSIKENRRECPCWLDMFTTGCPAKEIGLSIWSEGGHLAMDKRKTEDLVNGSTFTVPRDVLDYCSWAVTDGIAVKNGIYMIPEGRECDSLYTWRGGKDCRCENQKDTIVLHKQFCTVFMEVANPGPDPYPFTIRVRGTVKGYSMINERPVQGDAGFAPAITGNKVAFRLPRQNPGDPLLVDFFDGSSYLYSSDIGKEIRESGYDWNAADLADIRINVNYSRLKAGIDVCDWEIGEIWSTEI